MAALTTAQQTDEDRKERNEITICVNHRASSADSLFSSQLTVALGVNDRATVILKLEANAAKGNETRCAGLAAEFYVTAAKANLS